MFTKFTGQECADIEYLYEWIMTGLFFFIVPVVAVVDFELNFVGPQPTTFHRDIHRDGHLYVVGMYRWQLNDLFWVIGDIFVNICLRHKQISNEML